MGRHSKAQAMLALAPPFDQWPEPKQEKLTWPAKKVEKYGHQVEAVRLYIEGDVGGKTIQKITGVNRCLLAGLVAKCLAPGADGNIRGKFALEPHVPSHPYTRTKMALGKPSESRGYYAGVLHQVLRLEPRIEPSLISFVLLRAKMCDGNPEAVRQYLICAEFKRLLLAFEVPTSWPFGTRHEGTRSISRWIKSELIPKVNRLLSHTKSEIAKTRSQASTGTPPLLSFSTPFAGVEADAHKIDAMTTVSFFDGLNEVDVVLSRWWILAAVERVSSAVLAYLVVFSSEVRCEHVIELLKRAFGQPTARPTITAAYQKYAPGAGFPNALIPELNGAICEFLLLDNALAHLAARVHADARKIFGFTLNYGEVAAPERRPHVERAFESVEAAIFHQLPSSTGSDPIHRPPHAEENALKYRIRADDTVALADVHFANHNIRGMESHRGMSPLQILRHAFQGTEPLVMARRLPAYNRELADVLAQHDVRTVKGDPRNGRNLYVQYKNGQYNSSKLISTESMLGKKLHCFEKGGQYLNTYYDGHFYDQLALIGEWARFEHTVYDRNIIIRAAQRKEIDLRDSSNYIQTYMESLQSRLKESNSSKNSRRVAMELQRMKTAYPDVAALFKDTGQHNSKNPPPPSKIFDNALDPSGRPWKIKN